MVYYDNWQRKMKEFFENVGTLKTIRNFGLKKFFKIRISLCYLEKFSSVFLFFSVVENQRSEESCVK